MRAIFLDHVYPEAWNTLAHGTMDEWFRQSFGTSNFWELALKDAGHEAKTLVLNAYPTMCEMIAEAKAFDPDVVVSMEVGRFHYSTLKANFPDAMHVAFCSHHATETDLSGWHVVWSSFNWMPDYCRSIGVRCEYLPLAFGKPVLERVTYDGPRDIDVCFIGGLGMRTWKSGTETMAAIAEKIPEFRWWGYYQGALSDFPPALQKAYQGEAFGATMYQLLMRTKVVVNRHGEIARNFSNNCRVFEAQGCGALLLNDCGGILGADGVVYDKPEYAVKWIRSCLEYPEVAARTAARAKERILAEHCYENRVPRFTEVVNSL